MIYVLYAKHSKIILAACIDIAPLTSMYPNYGGLPTVIGLTDASKARVNYPIDESCTQIQAC